MAISTPTTAGQILTSAYVNNNINSGLVYVASASATGAQTVVVNNCFNSEYDNYVVSYSNLLVSTSGTELLLNLGAAVTNYSYSGFYNRPSSTPLLAVGGTSQTSWLIGYPGSATDRLSGTFEVYAPFLAQPSNYKAHAMGSTFMSVVGGYHSDSTSYSSLTIKISTGTLSSGSVTVYGYRKA
jgi:hypothetical protein